MRLIVDISGDRLEQLERLIKGRRYTSPLQFVNHAIDALLDFENEAEEGEGHANRKNEKRFSLPSLVQYRNLSVEVVPPNLPEDLWRSNGTKPWIWGQINSVLAIKFCVRVLANMLQDSKSRSIPLIVFINNLRPIASEVSMFLGELDRKNERGRDALYSKSFPSADDKSLSRFESQYVGIPRERKFVDSAIAHLGFARVTKDFNVGLTSYGLEFARAKNPIFDVAEIANNSAVLSDEEVKIYLKAVKEFSISERNSISTIGSLISEGKNHPAALDIALSQLYPRWSHAQVVTYRAGAVARMADLRILSKRKEKPSVYMNDQKVMVRYAVESGFLEEILSVERVEI